MSYSKNKKGDGKGRNVTPELFKEKIELADVKIVAVTNHNRFDYDQYIELREVVADICQVWPDVEIDIDGESRYHLIVVTKPDEVLNFNSCCKNLFSDTTPDTCFMKLKNVYNAFEEIDAIYIPHFHDKNQQYQKRIKNSYIVW